MYTKESLDENKNNFLNNSMELNSFQLKIKLRIIFDIVSIIKIYSEFKKIF